MLFCGVEIAVRSLPALVSELEGLLDIGSTAQVNSVLREVLNHSEINADAIDAAVRAIGMGQRPNKWRSSLENAYDRMSPRQQKDAGRHMLAFYFAISDSQAALPFTKQQYLQTMQDTAFAMDVLLDAGALAEAGRLAKRLERLASEQPFDEADAACLVEALASYHARMRNWEQAIALRSQVPSGQPGLPNAAAAIAELHIASAIGVLDAELARIEKLRSGTERDPDLALSLPGIEDDLLTETELNLSHMKRLIARMLPKNRRPAVGFSEDLP